MCATVRKQRRFSPVHPCFSQQSRVVGRHDGAVSCHIRWYDPVPVSLPGICITMVNSNGTAQWQCTCAARGSGSCTGRRRPPTGKSSGAILILPSGAKTLSASSGRSDYAAAVIRIMRKFSPGIHATEHIFSSGLSRTGDIVTLILHSVYLLVLNAVALNCTDMSFPTDHFLTPHALPAS